MGYFVTGGTGFIGRHLVMELTTRGVPVYVLVRCASQARLDRVIRDCGSRGGLIVPIEGDLTSEGLGVSAKHREWLRGKVDHFYHLGALYDLGAEADELERANVAGTRNAMELAADVQAGCFHLVSSIAAAGCYPGVFREDMFGEAQGLDHPYFRTKHLSEALVRSTCRVPWRIYRPGMVVGHSGTGEMDKIDGPYYLFKALQKVRDTLPQWLPLIGFEGGHINLVPVDFVAAALVHLAHVPGLDGKCFHLTDPTDRRLGEVLNLFARAAHAPTMKLRLEPDFARAGVGKACTRRNGHDKTAHASRAQASLLGTLGAVARSAFESLQPLRRLLDQLMRELGIPGSVLELLNYPTTFDSHVAQELLAPAGIRVPRLEDYAWRLWDYWERHLDPDLYQARSLREAVEGKTVLVTGGSSGIGRATALKLAEAGALVLIVARDPAKLASVKQEIESRGGAVTTFTCDVSDELACQQFIGQVLAAHGHVDILINNAGRSIRRAIENTYDRFHDYERLMRLNYFAAVRLTLGLLPAMVARGAGHVINISSIGVLTNASRFASYNASKAALDAFTRCAAAEFHERGIQFTVINMPLVRTPMVAPTRLYSQFPLIQPEQAADIICDAIIRRPDRVATGLGLLAQALEVLAPRINRAINSETFRLFPESEAAGGVPSAEMTPTPDMLAVASLMRGIHW